MTHKQARTKLGLRRVAPFLAALGMFAMSSGIALMVTASPATAANKVGICHATSSDSNPYVFVSVDDDSAKLKAHLQHKLKPNKKWKSAGTFHGVDHVAGDPKADLIGSFTDDQGVFHLYDGTVTIDDCNDVTIVEATADVDFIDPSCDNDNVADYDTSGSHVTFAITSGSAAPGAHIEVTATAVEPATFLDPTSTTQVFTHDFSAAADCTVVEPPVVVDPPVVDPPVVDPPVVDPPVVVVDPPVVTPTLVHAGLVTGPSTTDVRRERGLALLATGMIMMMLAGGLGLIRAGGQTDG